MPHVFKGQVKIEDVKNEFDYLINHINALINKYNLAAEALNFTIDTGSPSLAPEGYVLSIGGLKKIVNVYNGCTFGSHIFKAGDKYIVTAGIAFRNNKVIKLPQAVLTYYATGLYLEYNVAENRYYLDTVKTDTTDTVCVRAIHPYRDNILRDNNLLPSIHPTLRVFTGNASFAEGTRNYPTTDKEQFCTAMMGEIANPQDLLFLGKLFTNSWRTTSHNGKMFMLANRFFKPKGIGNPWQFLNDQWKNIVQVFGVIKRT